MLYYCNGCKAAATADEEDFIKMEDHKHSCIPIPYDPEKYIEIKIIKKPNYQILENCNTHTGKLLIIFDQNATNEKCCWEFRAVDTRTRFVCRDCNTYAKLWNKRTENEYIELRNVTHECKSQPYDVKNYCQFNDFILKPDYELQSFTSSKTGEGKKRLIIFDKADNTLCHIFTYARKTDSFLCQQCISQRVRVTAKLLQNSDGEEYVLLSKKKHICQGRPRSKALLKKEIIVRPPGFALMENTSSGRNKLFIFDSNNQNLCYTFTQQNRHQNIYYCILCRIAKNEIGKYLKIELCKDENGESFLRTNDLSHICNPKKYEPEKYEKKQIPKCFDYFFFRPQKRPDSIFVGIYHPEDKSLCYVITYWKYISSFQCPACKRKDNHWKIKMGKDGEDEKEYFNHDYKKHACKPVKVSTITAPKYVFLKRDDLCLAVKTKESMTDEDKIIKAPNFVLAPNKNDIPDASLFVFQGERNNESLGYRYLFDKAADAYKCCGKGCYAMARLRVNKSGEKCIILGKAHHRCDPIKYETFKKPDDRIIPDADFIKICANGNDRITTVIVFTTPARHECYEFAVAKEAEIFRCLACLSCHKYFSVKLCKDENGQEFLKLMKPEENHACAPRKYNKEKYEIKKQSYNFELMPNTKGEPNKKLIFFTSEKREFYYTFNSTSGRSYRCQPCNRMKRCIMAKVCDDKNGQQYVEYGSREHICRPKRYTAIKYS